MWLCWSASAPAVAKGRHPSFSVVALRCVVAWLSMVRCLTSEGSREVLSELHTGCLPEVHMH